MEGLVGRVTRRAEGRRESVSRSKVERKQQGGREKGAILGWEGRAGRDGHRARETYKGDWGDQTSGM